MATGALLGIRFRFEQSFARHWVRFQQTEATFKVRPNSHSFTLLFFTKLKYDALTVTNTQLSPRKTRCGSFWSPLLPMTFGMATARRSWSLRGRATKVLQAAAQTAVPFQSPLLSWLLTHSCQFKIQIQTQTMVYKSTMYYSLLTNYSLFDFEYFIYYTHTL